MKYKLTGYSEKEKKHVVYAENLTLVEMQRKRKQLNKQGIGTFVTGYN